MLRSVIVCHRLSLLMDLYGVREFFHAHLLLIAVLSFDPESAPVIFPPIPGRGGKILKILLVIHGEIV